MPYSQSTLISRIRRRLGLNEWTETGITSADGATSVTVADGTKYAAGGVIEFQDDGEQKLITSIAGNVLTVVADYNGTNGGAHTAAQIVSNPTIEYVQITQTITDVLDALWPHVYKKITADITPATDGQRYYSVAATFEDLSNALQMSNPTATNLRVPQVYGGRRSNHPITLVQNIENNFPNLETTGKAVYIPVPYNTTKTIRVNGIARITDTLTTGSYDDLPSSGVEISCVIHLAVAELVASPDIRRLLGEDTNMHDQTVVPGRRSQISENVWRRKGLRYRRQWAEQLRVNLPRMQRWG